MSDSSPPSQRRTFSRHLITSLLLGHCCDVAAVIRANRGTPGHCARSLFSSDSAGPQYNNRALRLTGGYYIHSRGAVWRD